MTTLDDRTRERIDSIVAAHAARPGPLLEVLHDVQRDFGFVPPAAIPQIARGLNLSRAEVHGVVSFYQSNSTWRTSITEINTAKQFQVRVTFVSNTDTNLSPTLSALGFAFKQ